MGWETNTEIKISAFVLTTNSIENQFPFIESIKSFLEIVDELIVVDGGSTDGTVEAIQAIGDNKIRIIQDEDTKWEKDWIYWRMGHNFNRALQECTGDWIIKFDADYILHEKGNGKFRKECLNGIKSRKLAIAFTRLNFIYKDSYYIKSKKTLAINTVLCKEVGIDLRYGFDLKNWGYGFEFINFEEYKHKINFGEILRTRGSTLISSANIFNYDYCFTDIETAKKMRSRHWLAEQRQRAIIEERIFNEVDGSWNDYKKQVKGNINRVQYNADLNYHPKIIQDKIKNITPEQQGFNCWEWFK